MSRANPPNLFQSNLPSELQKFRYLTEQQVSEIIGRGLQTLRNDRHRRRGLPYVKWPGGQVRYCISDVLAYMKARRIDPEAQRGGGS
jgi:hypothetical protein